MAAATNHSESINSDFTFDKNSNKTWKLSMTGDPAHKVSSIHFGECHTILQQMIKADRFSHDWERHCDMEKVDTSDQQMWLERCLGRNDATYENTTNKIMVLLMKVNPLLCNVIPTQWYRAVIYDINTGNYLFKSILTDEKNMFNDSTKKIETHARDWYIHSEGNEPIFEGADRVFWLELFTTLEQWGWINL